MAQQPIPEGIEVTSARDQRQGSIDKTDLDLEIERYQREIDDKQKRQRLSPSAQQPQQPQPYAQSPSHAAGYEVYVPIDQPEAENQTPSYQSPRASNDQSESNDDQPLYFSSMNPDRQKRKAKKPVNPRNRSQGGFLSKFFNKDKP
jgi:hypothetical protein